MNENCCFSFKVHFWTTGLITTWGLMVVTRGLLCLTQSDKYAGGGSSTFIGQMNAGFDILSCIEKHTQRGAYLCVHTT